jgi:hypothetical protein
MIARKARVTGLALLILFCCGQPASARKIGSEFKINTTQATVLSSSSVKTLTNGTFVVTWRVVDAGIHRAYAQRFTATGERAGSEFLIGPAVGILPIFPKVVALASGGFVIIGWDANAHVVGRRYSAAGIPIGAAFPIPRADSAAALTGGGFVVVYTDSDGLNTFAQRYSDGGIPMGGAVPVNAGQARTAGDTAVAALNDGGFVVTFVDQDVGSVGVYGRRYTASGVAAGGKFRVNVFTALQQDSPAVTGLPGGGFVVTWTSFPNQDGSELGVFGRRYTAAGVPIGGEFRVNHFTAGIQNGSAIASLADGGFVVLWESEGQDGSSYGVYGQRFNHLGARASGEFRVNTTTLGKQASPAVATMNNGGYVAVWETSENNRRRGIYGQRFKPE